MGNLYYKNIFNEDAKIIEEIINKTIIPYKKFIETSIKKTKKKSKIKVEWKKIGGDLIRLIPKNNKKLYRIYYWTELEIIKNDENISWFNIMESNDEFDIQRLIDNKIEVKNKEYKIKAKIIDNKDNEIKLELSRENIEKININKSFNIQDDEWGEAKLEPLWENNNKRKIGKIFQDSESLEYEVIKGNRIRIKNFNINKPLRDNRNKEININIIEKLDLEKQEEILIINNNNYIWREEETSNNKNIIYKEEYPDELINDLLFVNSTEKFEFITIENTKKLEFIVEDSKAIKDKELCYKNIEFVIEIIRKERENKYKIQLLDKESDNEDGIIKKSNLEYFFEDNVEIFSNNLKYRIKRGSAKASEYSFILVKDKTNVPVFPAGKELSLKISTYQLEKQYEALKALIEKPIEEQEKILKMFIDLKNVTWKDFKINKLKEKDWIVLTDSKRDGTIEQRNFVEKALSTEDFLVLEGPPGSGKTTAILELIYQLTNEGKKVLLCGSTHVAIDNVLERLKEKKLMDKILPIRIGDENRISDDVKEFQLNNIEIDDCYKDIFLESSNLVCGTTLGILQHPILKKSTSNQRFDKELKIVINENSIKPIYDYLIIDESSKTTFSEFLVPAMFAKKWILVGDVKQLAPYTDRDEIISSINTFINKNKREVLYLLYLFCMENKYNERGKKLKNFLIPLTNHEINEFLKEVKKKNNKKYLGKYLIITNKKKNYQIENKYFELECIEDAKFKAIYFEYLYDGIFIEKNCLKEFEGYISDKFLFFRNDEIKNYIFHFKQNFENISIKEIDDFNKILREKNWGEEIAWRLIREFELKDTKSQGRYLKKQLEDLYPVEENNLAENLFSLKTVAMPSVLEGFQRGIGKLENYHLTTSYTEGFENINKFNLNNRYEKLTYQHRMHPEISKIPRVRFYKNISLKDAKSIDREWKYNRYKKHSVWIDHNSKAFGSKNKEEVRIIKEEVKHLYNWKKSNSNYVTSVAILSFYKGQEKLLREMLQEFCSEHSEESQRNKMSQFYLEYKNTKVIDIKLYTVDKFQGQEADIVFLSMVNTNRVGFLDNPNRLNVAITRARYQMVYVGKNRYFMEQNHSEHLQEIAKITMKTRGYNGY